MLIPVIVIAALFVFAALFYFFVFIPWGTHWGATAEEYGATMPGDEYFEEEPRGSNMIVMTRAIDLDAPPETVWPWLAQMGRGAGFYSYDRIDNGGKPSARHIVSWIPEPALGDSSAIGYLRRIETGELLVWWTPGEKMLGCIFRMLVIAHIEARGEGTRLVIRISGDARGGLSSFIKYVFIAIDSFMGRRQLLGIKKAVEEYGVRDAEPEHPETGKRDQYQHYECIYASGEQVGVKGKEKAQQWRVAAIEKLKMDDSGG